MTTAGAGRHHLSLGFGFLGERSFYVLGVTMAMRPLINDSEVRTSLEYTGSIDIFECQYSTSQIAETQENRETVQIRMLGQVQ